MKKLLFTILLMLLPMLANAYDFKIGDIYYNYINGGNEVEVTYKSAGYATYSGVVNIPDEVTYNGKTMKVTSIGDLAFYECLSLTAISIPSSVNHLSYTAFSSCYNLKDVTIHSNSLLSKNYNDFVNVPLSTVFSMMQNLVIGDEVKSLGCQVFFESYNLKSVTIGSGVTSMAQDAFERCLNITSLTINSNDVVSKNYDENTSLISAFGDLQIITLGDKVTSIGDYAFYNCSRLLTLSIPNTVTSIGNYAFYDCIFLTSLNIPNSVKSIGDYAFYSIVSLTSLTLGNSLERIGNGAFYGCVNVGEIYCSAVNPPECGLYTFAGVNTETCMVYVPIGSSESYKNSEEWRNFKNINESAALGINQMNAEDAVAVGVYDMYGHRQNNLRRGINIIRLSNGKNKKVIVK